MRINLTQHQATPEQGCTEPADKSRVRSILTFEEAPSKGEIASRAIELATIAMQEGATEAMIGGAPFFMRALEDALIGKGIQPLYAFSRRDVVEDGPKKVAVFLHTGFIPAADEALVESCRRCRPSIGGTYSIQGDEIVYQAVSWHPWKDREYASRVVGKAAPGTAKALTCLESLEAAARKHNATQQEQAALAREEWIETLPDKVAGYEISKSWAQVQDEYGNFVADLPKIPMPPAEFERWVSDLAPCFD